jgi:phospholipase D1/2
MGTPIAVGHQTMRTNSGSLAVWLGLAAVLFFLCGLALAAWIWPLRIALNFDEFAGWLVAHRHAWYAPPAVVFGFVVLGLAMVPVIFLIAATGIAFGPLLGPVYAMAGCLASASTGFAIGRWMGLRRITQLGGERITRVTSTLTRNGTLTVFLVRKIPAPFTLVNIIVGASPIRFRDFIIGTVLGMGAFVVGLAGFGYQAISALRDPSPGRLIGSALFVVVPLTLALLINRTFSRLRPVE